MGMSAEEVANGCDAFVMLEDAAKQAGATTMFSASQSADALNYLALAGYTAEEACTALPKVLNLAAAGGLDLAYASDLVTDSMAALGLEMDELDSFMDKMAKTAQKSNTSVAQLGEATLTVGGTAKTLAGGVTEMNTALGILADVGIKGSEGGTALRNVILSLTAPTDKAAGALDELGVKVADAEGNMRPLEDIFNDLNKSMTGLGSVAKQQILDEIFNKVDLKAVSGLMAATVVDLNVLNDSLNKLGIDTQKNADMINYLASTFEVGENKAEFCSYAMQELGITAEQASGMYDELTTAIQKGSNRFDELSGYIDNAEGSCAKMAETMNDNLKGRLTELESATEGLGIQIYENLEMPLKSAAEAGIEAVGQLSTALESGGFSGMAEAIGSLLAQGLISIAEYAPQFINAAVLVIQSFVQGIIENLPLISESAISICGALLDGVTTLIPSLLQMGVEIVRNLADGITSNQSSISDSVSTLIDSLVNSITEALPSIIDGGVGIVTALIDGISQSLPTIMSKGVDIVLELIEGITENLDTIIDSGLKLLQALADGIDEALPKLLEKAPELITKLTDKLVENLPKIIDTATKIVVQLATTLIENAPQMLQAAITLMTSLIKSLLKHLPQIIEAGFKMVGDLAAGLIKNLPAIIKSIFSIAKTIIGELNKVDLITIGKQIIQGLISGIKSMVKSVGGAISSLCNDAVKAAKDALGIHSPSRVFKEDVGKWVGAGMAQGINDSAPEASKATADMCNSVLANGKAFLEKQKAQDKAWSKSKKEQYEAQKTALYDYIERKKEANQLSLEDEKYIYQQLLKAAKGNQKEIQEIKDKILEADEEAYQKRLANSKQFVADKKYYNQMSLQDELAAYERMKDYSKDHKEETKEIEKEIYRIKKEIKEKEIQDVKDANAKILDELKERVDAEKDIINGNRDSQLDALQAQLDAIDEAEEERQNNITMADYETSIQQLQQQLAEASNPEEQQRLNEQLFEKQQAFDEWKYQQELKAKKEAIRAQMDEVRANADEQIAVKEEQYQQEKSMIEQQQEAMIAAIQAGQQAMVQAVQDGGQQSLNIQDANAIMAMGINKSLTQDKEDNLNQQYEAVIDNEGKCAQAVEDACVEMYRKNYQMGAQMANGIADGILNQTWRAVKAIGMLCDKMIQEAQKKLDIHSPSRVFRKMGEFVDQGFSGGIDSGSGGVVNSMSAMCRKLTNAVDVDDLVGKMNAAVNGEIAITGGKFASGANSNVTTNTTTTNNNSSIPITVNNYGSTSEGRALGRELGEQVNRRLRGRGIVPC